MIKIFILFYILYKYKGAIFMNYYTSKDIKQIFHITSVTLCHWRQNNKIPFIKVNSKKFLYPKDKIDNIINSEYIQDNRKNVIYCRVSNQKQKNDLEKQKQILLNYCNSNGYVVNDIYCEIASGMNENRQQFNKMINDILQGNVKNVFVTYHDRLTRFGFDYFKNIFQQFNCNIIVLNNKINENDFSKELTNDLIDIIHHFSMKIYSHRRKQLKEIQNILKEGE
jgi:predicted site-specific integrase-resolvase